MAVYLRCAGEVAVILHYVTMCKLPTISFSDGLVSLYVMYFCFLAL